MKIRLRDFFAPGLALGGLALLLGPAASSEAFTIFDAAGLNLNQRDYRLHNIFADNQANNNNQPSAMYPGAFGADMALWKAAVEWGSTLHGDGSGDSGNPDGIGSGGADFDFYYAGEATSGGTSNNNIISVIPSCGGGTLAFVEGPINNGWRMTFCDEHTWSDGPGNAGNGQFNIQGVGLHEFGHSLGLGHSFFPTVMQPGTANGNDTRSLFFDDQQGVRFLYGNREADKPRITDVSFDPVLARITITGSDFPTGNSGQVWFTRANAVSTGTNPILSVTGAQVAATGTNPNMVINVTVPAGCGPGDVHVRRGTLNEGRLLSNGWPFNPGTFTIPDALTLTSVSQTNIEVLNPGTAETITLTGTGFNAATQVNVSGTPVTGLTVVNDTTLTVDMPNGLGLGVQALEVTNGFETDQQLITIVANASNTLEVGNGDLVGNDSSETVSFPLILAHQPGKLVQLLASNSNVPSFLPAGINLSIGNAFTELIDLGFFFIPASGQQPLNITPTGLAGNTFYFQTLEIPLPFGFPLPESNLQAITIIP